MKKKKIVSLMLAGVLSFSTISISAYAAKEDAAGDGADTIMYSSSVVTVPENLEDGTYVGDANVEPDDSDGFNFYPISVAVKVQDGSIESFLVTGASGQNVQYSKRAEEGINTQMSGKTAGDYNVDAVSMATCSSHAIVQGMNKALQGEPTGTAFTLGESVYHKDGTSFYVTVIDPKEGKDYSEITIAHALGKFSQELVKDTDYSIEEVASENASEIRYKITILPTGSYEIDDDDMTHSGSYNKLGQNLDVTVAGASAGRIIILSAATVELRDNILTLSGGNGETLEDYISNIGQIEVTYTDKNGEQVSNQYSTQWQHDIEPEFTGADFFQTDGSVNFAISPFANGESGNYTITVESSGFDTLTATVGGVVAGANNVGSSNKTNHTNGETQKQNKDKSNQAVPVKGTKFVDTKTKVTYKVIKSGKTGGTVQFMKSGNKKAKVVSLPAAVNSNGITYKVTSIAANAFKNNKSVTKVVIGKNISNIGKNAFKGCSKLKTITIKSSKLTNKNVGAKAFAGIHAKATVKVPKAKLANYKKLLKKKGLTGKKQKVK